MMRFDDDAHVDETPRTNARMPLLRRAIPLAVAAGLAVALVPTIPSGVAAHDDTRSRRCSERTLRGDYGLLASGVRAVPPFLGGGTERWVATALWTFDGNGAFTQGPGAGLHGEVTGVAPDAGEIPGTYEVNANCTGKMELHVPELPFPIQYTFVIVDDAREVKAAVMAPGTATAELTRK